MKEECSVYQAMDIIGKRWTIILLLELYKGQDKWKRYSHIKRSVPDITPKILSSRLKDLEKEKLIIKRVDASAVPVKSEYSLTKSGLEMIGIIKDMKKWVLRWDLKNRQCKSTECKTCNF